MLIYHNSHSRVVRRELGDSFGSFRNGMLGKFTWEYESNSRLNFSGAKSMSFVVCDKFACFTCQLFKNVIDERVHDAHWSLWDSSFWMNLFQYSINIDWKCLCSLLMSFGGDGFLNWSVSSWFGWHLSCIYLFYFCKF